MEISELNRWIEEIVAREKFRCEEMQKGQPESPSVPFHLGKLELLEELKDFIKE